MESLFELISLFLFLIIEFLISLAVSFLLVRIILLSSCQLSLVSGLHLPEFFIVHSFHFPFGILKCSFSVFKIDLFRFDF